MADNSGIIKIGLIGAAAWLAYKQGWLAFLGIGLPVAAPATAAPAAIAPGAPAAAAPSMLDGIFSRVQSAAGSGAQLDPDEWDWYLNNELAALGKGAAPDPVGIFGQRPFSKVGAAQWWGPMSAALRSQLGLSGLGIYGGLAALSTRYR